MEISFGLVIIGIVLIVFFLYWLTSFFLIYHLARFGIGLLPKRLAALFLIGAVAIFSVIILNYISIDLETLKNINLL